MGDNTLSILDRTILAKFECTLNIGNLNFKTNNMLKHSLVIFRLPISLKSPFMLVTQAVHDGFDRRLIRQNLADAGNMDCLVVPCGYSGRKVPRGRYLFMGALKGNQDLLVVNIIALGV